MITICLDEFGHFEMEKYLFVGGVVYTGDDVEEEKERITNYLKSECETAGGLFPQDLHRNHLNTDYQIVNKIKKNIALSIENYLKNNGKYHIICMVNIRTQRESLKKLSNIIDDSVASNLYEHMMCGIINNILFSNMYLEDENEVNLEVATRIAVIPIDDKEKINEFESLGYKGNYKEIWYDNKKCYSFYATDEKTFKTSISSAIMYKKRNDLTFKNINIQPIIYTKHNDSMPFLYLADAVCSSISEALNKDNKDYGLSDLQLWGKNATGGNEPFLWAYDDINITYNNIMDSYHKKDVYDFMNNLYEGNNSKSDFVDYYKKYWFNTMKKNLENVYDKRLIDISINKMDHLLRDNNLIQDKAVFIFEGIWEIVKKNIDNINKKYIYKIADAGIRVYNHKGDIKKTEEFYSICKGLKDSVDIDEYLDTINKVAVIYADRFEFDKAYEISLYNADCLLILKKAKMDITMLNNINSEISVPPLGRALSSCGQYLAFMNDNNALIKFENALLEFEGDEANTAITISYLLHYAADKGDIKLYEEYCVNYFGGYEELEKQFDYISSDIINDKSKDYTLYVFTKAVNCLYSNCINDSLIKKLRETDYKVKGFNIEDHPWELIYKQIGLILYKNNMNKYGKKFMENAYTCIKMPQTTIIAINYFSKIQEAFYEDDYKLLSKIIKEFKEWTKLETGLTKYFEECFVESLENTYKNLNKKFTYTYR